MNVIICLDDKNGVSFNRRRQSRDRGVAQDILNMAEDHCVYIKPYSSILFEEILNEEKKNTGQEKLERTNIKMAEVKTTEDFAQAEKEDYVFLECADAKTLPEQMHRLIVYRWNRVYPADIHFEFPENYRQTQTEEFPGFSHEKITKEIYEPVLDY